MITGAALQDRNYAESKMISFMEPDRLRYKIWDQVSFTVISFGGTCCKMYIISLGIINAQSSTGFASKLLHVLRILT